MSEKFRNLATLVLASAVLFGLFLWGILKPADLTSESERRQLTTLPELSVQSFLSGKFMGSFEDYANDQFPMRDFFRSVKAYTAVDILHNKDVNKIYMDSDGYLSKLEYPLSESSLQNAADRLMNVYNKHLDLEGVNVYFSIIPDKNYFMAEKSGALMLDYEALEAFMLEKTPGMQYINIFDCLELEDYYKTDTHWRQEKLSGVTARLAAEMGIALSDSFVENTLDKKFYGVYSGQSAMNISPETLYYLTNDTLNGCTVFDYETNREIPLYDMEKASGKDSYELFLSGSKSMLRISNPNASGSKKLIVFRDSFGSSLVPLLCEAYSETYVIDIRYISSEIIGQFVDFENCDVLFIYSTLVLNNSVTLK